MDRVKTRKTDKLTTLPLPVLIDFSIASERCLMHQIRRHLHREMSLVFTANEKVISIHKGCAHQSELSNLDEILNEDFR